MGKNEKLSLKEIVEGLKDLANDRKSFFNKYGDDEIFRHDYKVCMEAAKIIKGLERKKK